MIDPAAIAGLTQAGATALGLTLSDDSRVAVGANLATLLERAADFMTLPVEDALDPAPLLRL